MAARRVALIVGMNISYGRDILRGVLDYARNHGGWKLAVEGWWEAAPFPNLHDVDGLIAHLYDESLAHIIASVGVPTVNISSVRAEARVPQVISDNHEAGRLAARHLLLTGLRHFAFCGYPNKDFSRQRCEGFGEAVGNASAEFYCYQGPQRDYESLNFDQQQNDLRQWIASLPRPVGIMAANDFRGRHVLDICDGLGLSVPDDVSVVGVDNDELLCDFADPPLTSVALDGLGVGRKAAALLEHLMEGAPPPAKPMLIPPTHVAVRQSTRVPGERVHV